MKREEKRCHPETGEARRGTSQALNRYRETVGFYVVSIADPGLPLDIATARPLAVFAARDDNPNA